MRIFVTGASGYIGRYLVEEATRAGHQVISGSRRRPAGAKLWIPYELALPAQLPSGTTHVVHLAADTSGLANDADLELSAAVELARAAVEAGAIFLFVSSQSAQPNAPSSYGRTKWAIEQAIAPMSGLVVRPGQVYGGREEGLFGALIKGLRKLRVIPWLLPSPKVQPIHVKDCVQGILRVLEQGASCESPLMLASAPVAFNEFLRAMAHARVHGKVWNIPVPLLPIRLVSAFSARLLGDRSPFQRVDSLLAIPLMDTTASLARISLKPRSLEEGMSRSGGTRRCLLREAFAFHRYLMKAPATIGFSRRYAHAIESLRDGACLGLPHALLASPGLMAAIDIPSYTELRWRLDAATAIAEASAAGYGRFNAQVDRWPWLRAAFGLLAAVAGECLARLVRPLVLAFWRVPTPAGGNQQP